MAVLEKKLSVVQPARERERILVKEEKVLDVFRLSKAFIDAVLPAYENRVGQVLASDANPEEKIRKIKDQTEELVYLARDIATKAGALRIIFLKAMKTQQAWLDDEPYWVYIENNPMGPAVVLKGQVAHNMQMTVVDVVGFLKNAMEACHERSGILLDDFKNGTDSEERLKYEGSPSWRPGLVFY